MCETSRPDLVNGRRILKECSTDECYNLIYSDEGVRGDLLLTYFDPRGNEVHRLGLYCDECSMALGYFPPRLLDRIELMLRAEGMLDTKKHPAAKRETVSKDQGRLI